ncbi:hypothetical protein Q0S14_14585, partial [Escherichia coli O83:H32]
HRALSEHKTLSISWSHYQFLQSYQSPEVAKAAETIFNGGAVPGW